MPEILDLGEFSVPWEKGITLLMELTQVRAHVRKLRYGEVDRVDGYRLEVTRANGTIETWEFGSNVGYPKVDGNEVDWKALWMDVEN